MVVIKIRRGGCPVVLVVYQLVGMGGCTLVSMDVKLGGVVALVFMVFELGGVVAH